MTKTKQFLLNIIFSLTTAFCFGNSNHNLLLKEWETYNNNNLNDTIRYKSIKYIARHAILSRSDSVKLVLEKQMQLAIKIDKDVFFADYNHNLGDYHRQKGNFSQAINAFLNALSTYERLEDLEGIANINLSIGGLYTDINQLRKALKHTLIAKDIYQSINKRNKLARCYNNIGIIKAKLFDFESSLDFQKKALNLKKKVGKKWDIGISYNTIGFSYCNMLEHIYNKNDTVNEMLKKQLIDSAFKYHHKALTIFSDQNSSYDIAYGYLGIGETFQLYGLPDSAIFYYKKAFDISNKLAIFHIAKDACLGLSNTYKKIKDHHKGLFWLEKHIEYKNKIFLKEQQFELGTKAAEIEYETKRIATNKKHQHELAIKQSKINFWIKLFSILSFTFLLLWIFNSWKNANKLRREHIKGFMIGEEKEKKRNAQELHDNIGQRLAIIKSKLIQSNTKSIANEIEEVISDVRAISKNIFPAYLDTLGIEMAIDKLIQDISSTTDIIITYEIDSSINQFLNEQKQINVYRIVQELINNGIKHAKPTAIRIEGKIKNEDYIEFKYCDNGIGIVLTNKTIGIGIFNIKNRLKAINGKWQIKSKPGNTVISFTLKK